MRQAVFKGRANPGLAEAVTSKLGVDLGRCTVEDFPDHEMHVVIHDQLEGHDVFLIQPTHPPVADHLLELLLLADTIKRMQIDFI